MTDLEERLVQAASAAIRNQTPALTGDAGYVKSITLELSLANGHQVVDSTCWVERRTSAGALLARHIGKEPAA